MPLEDGSVVSSQLPRKYHLWRVEVVAMDHLKGFSDVIRQSFPGLATLEGGLTQYNTSLDVSSSPLTHIDISSCQNH